MKKLSRNLLLLFSLWGTALSVLSVWAIFHILYRQSNDYLSSVLSDAKAAITYSEQEHEIQREAATNEFLRRAETVKNICAGADRYKTPPTAEEIKQLADVRQIYFFDGDGRLTDSTCPDKNQYVIRRIGQRVAELSRSADSYDIRLDLNREKTDVQSVFVLKKLEDSAGSVAVVECSPMYSGISTFEQRIAESVKTMPTEWDTVILAIDIDDIQVVGMTSNNLQNFGLEDRQTLENLVKTVKTMTPGKVKLFPKLGGYPVSMGIEMYSEGLYLVGIDFGSDTHKDILKSLIVIIGGFSAGFAFVIFYIRQYIKRMFLADIDDLKTKIPTLLAGDFAVDFTTCRTEEVEKLVSVIRQLKQGYISKSERVNKIFNMIGPNVAAFEMGDREKEIFFTDNFMQVTGVSRRDLEFYTKDRNNFRRLIKTLFEKRDSNGILRYKDKYLELHSIDVDDEIVGVVIDRTREEMRADDLQKNLRQEKVKNDIDSLTGILNRHGFERAMTAHKMQNGGRYKGALLILDLDNFKRINDELGHPEGDKVLKIFGEMLSKVFRKEDIIGRVGGDEFMVYLTGSITEADMNRKLESLIKFTAEYFEQYEKYGLSCSVGAAAASEGIDFAPLYAKADRALYKAKQRGKNRYYILMQ